MVVLKGEGHVVLQGEGHVVVLKGEGACGGTAVGRGMWYCHTASGAYVKTRSSSIAWSLLANVLIKIS